MFQGIHRAKSTDQATFHWGMYGEGSIERSVMYNDNIQFWTLSAPHNTIYDYLWEDPPRHSKPCRVDEFARMDPETRFIVVGDASMAPYEIMATDGSIHIEERSGRPSLERLQFLARTFRHSAWLNPKLAQEWPYTRTINVIREIFPMFEITLDGLEKMVTHLMSKN